ncbi:phosphomethylpyrimidine synthase ThiC [Desulfobacterales bacterium HSG2]|nr:phosphomethylpyrimidine synthase ThiC [Desulfobacterales bacterium HSG2]
MQDVIEGVKVARLSAHIGDIGKYPCHNSPLDLAMSKSRRNLNWEDQFKYALFPMQGRRIEPYTDLH